MCSAADSGLGCSTAFLQSHWLVSDAECFVVTFLEDPLCLNFVLFVGSWLLIDRALSVAACCFSLPVCSDTIWTHQESEFFPSCVNCGF